ncbi:PRC-barrel domain containing protein [Rhodobacteraceae bacterium]|nr:PRC-barrel domain containing protein [Paracoccaceae bacterium]
MRKLLATTAITVMAALPVMAQTDGSATGDTGTAAQVQPQSQGTTGNETFYGSISGAVDASDFIGKSVYATDAEVTAKDDVAAMKDEWDNIGEVSDVVFGTQGDVEAVLVDVGGFLGIGEKTVAVNLDALQMVPGDDADDYNIVMKGDRATLEDAPAYDRSQDAAQAEPDAGTPNTATDTSADTATAASIGSTLSNAASEAADWTEQKADSATSAVSQAADDAGAWTEEKTAEAGSAADKAGEDIAQTANKAKNDASEAMKTEQADAASSSSTDWSQITPADLSKKTIYGPNDESVGKVSEVLTDESNQIKQVIVNVGGFLGLGAKPVALSPEQMEISQGADGLTIHIAATQEELEQMPEYEGS